jgi:hypothetical protein
LNETLRVVSLARELRLHGRDGAMMGKRSRQKRQRRREARRRQPESLPPEQAWPAQPQSFAWTDHDGLHALVPGEAPSRELLGDISRRYRDLIRQSPLWEQMIAQFGVQEAERLLSQFGIELR